MSLFAGNSPLMSLKTIFPLLYSWGNFESLVMKCEEKICSRGKEGYIFGAFYNKVYEPQGLEEKFFGRDWSKQDPQLDLFNDTPRGRAISYEHRLGFRKWQ